MLLPLLALLLTGPLLPHPAQANGQSLQMKFLLLAGSRSEEENTVVDFAENALRGYGIPFELLRPRANTPLPLESRDGSANYYALVLTSSRLLTPNSKGGLSRAQLAQLSAFQKKFGVRAVVLAADASALAGLRILPQSPKQLRLDPAFAAIDPALQPNHSFANQESTQPVLITDTRAFRPFAHFADAKGRSLGAAGVVETTQEQVEKLFLFYKQQNDAPESFALATSWIQWLTRGIFLGQRRVYLSAQVDDLFLETDMSWVKGVPGSVPRFRISPADVEYFVALRRNALTPLAQNPEFRVELAFNGQGIELAGGFEKDPLTQSFRKHLREFNWVSHTWSHLDLNKASEGEVSLEASLNIKMAKRLMAGAENFYSWNAIVTPGISGLTNGHALRALKANGIFVVDGDNSVPELLPPNPQNAYWSTPEKNHEAGILIMPREATSIDFDLSLPEEEVRYFRKTYPEFGKASFEKVYDHEVELFLPNLLNYRETSFMFHQANLRAYERGGRKDSLLAHWLVRMLEELRAVYTLPVLSLKMQELATLYLRKMAIAECAPQARLQVESGRVQLVEISAQKGSCDAAISVTGNSFVEKKGETYGPDSTVWLNLKAGRNEQLSFDQPQNW